MTAAPWKPAAAPSSQFSLANYVGELLLVCIGGVHEQWRLNSGDIIPAVRANVVVLSGPDAGREWLDSLMFAVIVVDQARNDAGGIVLARVCAKRGRGNNDMYWLDSNVTPADDQLARSWDTAYPGRLTTLQQLAVSAFNNEEFKSNGGRPPGQQQAAPPPPPPPAPVAPPPAFPPPPPAQAPEVLSGPPPWAGGQTGSADPWAPAPAGSADTPPY